MDYKALMARAYKWNAKRDLDDVKVWGKALRDEPFLSQIETGMEAIKAGIVTDDWNTVAEGLAIFEVAISVIKQKARN